MDPTGRFVFLTDLNDDRIYTYRVGANGSLAQMGPPQFTPDSPNNLTVHPSGRSVYVTSGTDAGADRLSFFSVGSDGTLTVENNTFAPGNFPADLVATPIGNVLYVCSFFAGSIGRWAISGTGNLTGPTNTGLGAGFPITIATTP